MNLAALLSALKWARDHWRGLSVAAGLAAAFAGGYRLYPRLHPPVVCAPAVVLKVDDHSSKATEATRETEKRSGPETITTTTEVFSAAAKGSPNATPSRPIRVGGAAPEADASVIGSIPAGSILVKRTVTVDQRGPTDIKTSAVVDSTATEDHHVNLHVIPTPAAPLPRFSLFWEPRIRPDVGLGIVGGGVRVTDSVWIDGWAEPSARVVGAGIRFTF